ncbi:uncharacterized protein [Nicotiana tomentosiformis]|uniref:uncharacterized protein n=1 Tax=Nicotiana tomentosiformis TaxID=4098 RepID=UPI00388C81CF
MSSQINPAKLVAAQKPTPPPQEAPLLNLPSDTPRDQVIQHVTPWPALPSRNSIAKTPELRMKVRLETKAMKPNDEKKGENLEGGTQVERFIASQWKIAEKPRVHYHNDGYFLIHFHSMEDRNRAMSSTPNIISNKPIIVREWTTDFNFKEEMQSTLPLWVRFPKLPMNCWGVKSLSRIASNLGVPNYADDCTTRINRISYARVLIEIDITKELSDKIVVRNPNGKSFEQEVTYD